MNNTLFYKNYVFGFRILRASIIFKKHADKTCLSLYFNVNRIAE